MKNIRCRQHLRHIGIEKDNNQSTLCFLEMESKLWYTVFINVAVRKCRHIFHYRERIQTWAKK